MKPPNVTLDNMCIIDLEQSREDASQIKRLIQMHHDKEISLRVVAASASELKQDGESARARLLVRARTFRLQFT